MLCKVASSWDWEVNVDFGAEASELAVLHGFRRMGFGGEVGSGGLDVEEMELG